MDLLVKRENELTKIQQYTGRSFFTLYTLGFVANFALRKGTMPFFKQLTTHTVLLVAGTFVTAKIAEKIAAEFYYNQVLINLSNKYNFSPEEVLDL